MTSRPSRGVTVAHHPGAAILVAVGGCHEICRVFEWLKLGSRIRADWAEGEASPNMDSTVPDGGTTAPTSRRARPVHCKVCTIRIGEGYQETRPIALPDAKGVICWSCYESLRRRAERRATLADGDDRRAG